MRTAIFAFVIAAGCGGSSKPSTTAKVEGPTCTDVAESMVTMMGEGKESTKAFVDAKEGFTTIIRTRCDDDNWTADAKRCLATMKSHADAEHCSTMLSEEQQANLVRDEKAKFGAGSEPTPQAETGGAPAPAAPVEAEKDRAAPKPKTTTKTRKTGDPCDGGE